MNPTTIAILVPLIGWALCWIGWDVYVVCRYGLASGKTISWQIYQDSRKSAAVGLFTGLTIGLLLGHLFLGMPGVE